jgi:hypothetical protein
MRSFNVSDRNINHPTLADGVVRDLGLIAPLLLSVLILTLFIIIVVVVVFFLLLFLFPDVQLDFRTSI